MVRIKIIFILSNLCLVLNSCAQDKNLISVKKQSLHFFNLINEGYSDSAQQMMCSYTFDRNEYLFKEIVEKSNCLTSENINKIECKFNKDFNLYTSTLIINCNGTDFVITIFFSRSFGDDLIILSLGFSRYFDKIKTSGEIFVYPPKN
ncbi:MAG: hypothetical protein IPP53_01110 [Bacteroidetes bacterium]|nr:hypothetical protein [Bacteroidota bacterium]